MPLATNSAIGAWIGTARPRYWNASTTITIQPTGVTKAHSDDSAPPEKRVLRSRTTSAAQRSSGLAVVRSELFVSKCRPFRPSLGGQSDNTRDTIYKLLTAFRTRFGDAGRPAELVGQVSVTSPFSPMKFVGISMPIARSLKDEP